MSTATIINQLQGSFHCEKTEEGEFEHYLNDKCVQEFIEDMFQFVRPESHVCLILEVYDK